MKPMALTLNLLKINIIDKVFIGRLYKQIKEYKLEAVSKIILGNMSNKRDYIPIDDAVKKYILIMERGTSGEVYNVGSG
jgi:nucleoside-diphosphate-sugar epimerase